MLCPPGTHAVDRDADGCEEACDCCPTISCLGGQTPYDTDGDGCTEQCCTSPEACACQPTGGGPYYLAETQSVTIPVACATGLGLSGTDFTVSGLPAGAVYNPGNATIGWTPTLAQAGIYAITITSPSAETATVRVVVADKAGTPAQPVAVGNSVISLPSPVQCPSWVAPANHLTEEYGLPTAYLYPFPTSTTYQAATFVYGTHCYSVQAHQHGAFSLAFPKKSVTIKFADSDLFNDPAHGFFNKKRIVMLQTYDDASGMRPRLMSSVWDALGPSHVKIQSFSAVMYQGTSQANAAYWGLYTIIDHLDKRFLHDQAGFSPNLWPIVADDFQGNLYQDDVWADMSDPIVPSDYIVQEGTGYADLSALITFINTGTQAAFDAGIASQIVVDDYVDAWILTTFFRMDDSASHNLHQYHQVQPSSQPWRAIPWDFNLSVGQGPFTEPMSPSFTEEFTVAQPGIGSVCWGYSFKNYLFDRLRAGTWGQYMTDRYADQLAGPLSKCALLARIDAMEAEIGQEALRDEAMWNANSNTFFNLYCAYASNTTHLQEVAYMKQWIVDRWNYQNVLYP